MKLVTVAEMLSIEKEADTSGLTYAQMMENAGTGLAEIILEELFDTDKLSAIALVGSGNNGGDALVALEHLASHGWEVTAYLVKRKADELVTRVEDVGGTILTIEKDNDFEALFAHLETSHLLLDGLLGTGIKLPLRDPFPNLLNAVKDALEMLDEPPLVVAVDCPSGVDCDTGDAAEECIPADLTITMAAVKQGLLKLPAFELVGELVTIGIGLPDDLPTWQAVENQVADSLMVTELLPERPLDGHKGTFGTAFIVAGSVNYTGAALLSGRAAYRVGAGLVKMGVPNPVYSALAGQLPEATWVLFPHQTGVIARNAVEILLENIERASALLIGPGFGTEKTTRDFLADLLKGKDFPKKAAGRIGFVQETGEEAGVDGNDSLPPLVIDADGLRLLAEIDDWQNLLSTPAVLTPHPGEMSALTGLSVSEIQANRLGVAKAYAMEWQQVVVLKGAFTVVASPDGKTTTIPVASPALARAGTGDVLAGLIVGLCAQGLEVYDAAISGAWIHAQAGLLAADAYGSTASVLAGDVLEAVPDVMAELE
jgi:NAD(P)H-hydrate epimerase